jgi:tetratricopeptide (TPR) repeat protein
MGIFSQDEEPGWSDVIHLEEQVEKFKQDIEAYKQSEQEASEIIVELKEEVRQLQRRNPEELYTLFGRPIKYWEQLEQENEKLKALCDTYRTCYQAKHSDIKCLFIKYKQALQEIKKIANYWQNRWWNDIDERQGFDEILDIITKAEEE